VPKRDSVRRRANKPKSYGKADPTTGAAATARPSLGIVDPEPQIAGMWKALQTSAESRFYSESDWERVRAELSYGNTVLAKINAGEMVSSQAWKIFQDGLTELLISPAAKRRAGIELKPASDADAVAADAKVLELASRLQA